MRPYRVLATIGCILLIAGCGSSIRTSSPTTLMSSATSLNGDWNLSGNRALKQYPALTVSMEVNGNQITANGDMLVQCSNIPFSAGGDFTLTGTIASDGTFKLTQALPSSLQVAITGTVPAQGQAGWTGTYSITDSTGYTSCLVNQSAAVTAVALAPLNGTYAGTLTSQSGSLAVSITLAQGPPVLFTETSGASLGYLPLTGSVAVTGSSCFTRGTAVASFRNQIQGDLSFVTFAMSDGSQVLFNGIYASPDESSLQFVEFPIIGGQCDGQIFAGALTRQ
jgi:hypothetical protein